MFRVIWLCFVVIFLSACSFGRPLMKGAEIPKHDEAYFIFGLKPSKYKVQIFSGSINSEGRFRVNPFANATFNSVADKGYAVGRTGSDSVLAITRVYLKGTGSLISPSFVPCKEAETLVFTATGGKVIYLTDIDYTLVDGTLEVGYQENFEAARQYLESDYPDLAPLLEQGKYDFAKTTNSCTGIVYVPVYISR